MIKADGMKEHFSATRPQGRRDEATHRGTGYREDEVFKLGTHGLVFRWAEDQWIRSTTERKDIVQLGGQYLAGRRALGVKNEY